MKYRGAARCSPVGLDTRLPGGQQRVPHRHVPRVVAVAGRGEHRGAAALEHEVRRVAAVGLQREVRRGGVGRLPQRRVAITVTHAELVPLLREHDLVHLGEYPRLPHARHLITRRKLQLPIVQLTYDI